MPKRGKVAKALVGKAGALAGGAAGPSVEDGEASVEERAPRTYGKRPLVDRVAELRDKGFRPVSVMTLTAVGGGFLKQPEVVPVLTVAQGGREDCFVKLCCGADWLCRAVTGEGRVHSPLQRVAFLSQLRAKARLAQLGPEAAVAEMVDPAAQLGFSDDEAPELAAPNKKAEKKRAAAKLVPTVVEVFMPARCAEAYPDEAEADQREIRLYAHVGAKRAEVWIHDTDLPWALEYMHEQYALQGVPRIKRAKLEAPSVEEAGSPSVEAGAGGSPQIEWLFKESAWQAIAPSPGGARRRVLKPEGLQLWEAKLVDGSVEQLEDLERQRVKLLAFGVLEKWAAAMSEGRGWTADAGSC